MGEQIGDWSAMTGFLCIHDERVVLKQKYVSVLTSNRTQWSVLKMQLLVAEMTQAPWYREYILSVHLADSG